TDLCRSATALTPSAATRRRDNRPSPSRDRRAVEKPGPWKPWKTKPRFPTVPTVLWKSPKPGISTFPPLRRLFPYSQPESENLPRPVVEAQRDEKTKPDRSRVNQTGQIDKLRTPLPPNTTPPNSSILNTTPLATCLLNHE